MIQMAPWGYAEVFFDDGACMVRRLIVEKGHQLSCHYHRERREYWIIVSGTALVFYGHSRLGVYLTHGGTFRIEKDMWHRLKNVGDSELIVIEVQCGRCIDEDVILVEDGEG